MRAVPDPRGTPPPSWPERKLVDAAIDALAEELRTRGSRSSFSARLDARQAARRARDDALRFVPADLHREAIRDWEEAASWLVDRGEPRLDARERRWARAPRSPAATDRRLRADLGAFWETAAAASAAGKEGP